jgi:ferredoxin
MRVSADQDRCVGAGQCAIAAPAVFDQDDEGVVMLLAADPAAHEKAVQRAVRMCPSGAIALIRESP